MSSTAQPSEGLIPQLKIIYEDSDMVVVDKPAGLLVHPAHDDSGPSVVDYARQISSDPDPDRPGIVHRLDRDTSGLLILAKTAEAKRVLQQAFKERQVHKTYTMLVHGHPEPPRALLRLPVGRTSDPTKRGVAPDGRPAETSYAVVKTYPGFSLIQAEPTTGRTHQLRVQFKHLGHPVVGDQLYGHEPNLGLARQFLHASRLQLKAPGGSAVDLGSPLPPELEQVLRQLEK